MSYTIAAIPTLYRGRRYRSRLEARWAAFFDLLGWNYEYEPCDLGTWSPDFAIWGLASRAPVLTEVKPIQDWDRRVARKMSDACDPRDGHFSRLLLLGERPITDMVGFAQIGFLGSVSFFEADWDAALLGRALDGRYDIMPNDCLDSQESWFWSCCYDLEPFDAEPLWTQAANEVQWHPKGARS